MLMSRTVSSSMMPAGGTPLPQVPTHASTRPSLSAEKPSLQVKYSMFTSSRTPASRRTILSTSVEAEPTSGKAIFLPRRSS